MLEGDLPSSALEKVRPAHDVGDSLQGIIHDDRELVGKDAVPAPHDDISQLAHGKRYRSLEAIIEDRESPCRRP